MVKRVGSFFTGVELQQQASKMPGKKDPNTARTTRARTATTSTDTANRSAPMAAADESSLPPPALPLLANEPQTVTERVSWTDDVDDAFDLSAFANEESQPQGDAALVRAVLSASADPQPRIAAPRAASRSDPTDEGVAPKTDEMSAPKEARAHPRAATSFRAPPTPAPRPYPLTPTDAAREDGLAQAPHAIAETQLLLERLRDPNSAAPTNQAATFVAERTNSASGRTVASDVCADCGSVPGRPAPGCPRPAHGPSQPPRSEPQVCNVDRALPNEDGAHGEEDDADDDGDSVDASHHACASSHRAALERQRALEMRLMREIDALKVAQEKMLRRACALEARLRDDVLSLRQRSDELYQATEHEIDGKINELRRHIDDRLDSHDREVTSVLLRLQEAISASTERPLSVDRPRLEPRTTRDVEPNDRFEPSSQQFTPPGRLGGDRDRADRSRPSTANTDTSASSTSAAVRIDTKNLPPAFTGDSSQDPVDFVRSFEASTEGATDAQRLRYLRSHCVKGPARNILFDSCEGMTYLEAKEKLLAYFANKTYRNKLRHSSVRPQAPDESIRAYALALQLAAIRLQFLKPHKAENHNDSALIKRFIAGLRSEPLSRTMANQYAMWKAIDRGSDGRPKRATFHAIVEETCDREHEHPATPARTAAALLSSPPSYASKSERSESTGSSTSRSSSRAVAAGSSDPETPVRAVHFAETVSEVAASEHDGSEAGLEVFAARFGNNSFPASPHPRPLTPMGMPDLQAIVRSVTEELFQRLNRANTQRSGYENAICRDCGGQGHGSQAWSGCPRHMPAAEFRAAQQALHATSQSNATVSTAPPPTSTPTAPTSTPTAPTPRQGN